MKILKIAFKNINSLQGAHEIDFREAPFYGETLFAITGATGSGKSTILDILVLALFNRTPRLDSVSRNTIEKTGALLTRGQKEAYARVTYECPSGEFTSEWSISTARTGNLRDYDMQLSDVLTQQSLVEKKSEVPAKNEELIGLKYDQFVKSVMLAQGDFAEFLVSNKSERTSLLEKITGTEIYRKIGMRVYDKFRLVRDEVDDFEKEIKTWQAELLEEEKIKELLTQQDDFVQKLEKNTKELTQFNDWISIKNELISAKKELETWKQKQSENQKNLEAFEKNEGVALLQHKKVAPIQNELNQWSNIQKNLQEKLEILDKIQKELASLGQRKKAYHTKIGQFLQKEVNEADYEKELQEFEDKVEDLEKSLEQQKTEGKALKKEINYHLQSIDMSLDDHKYRAKLEDLKTLQKTATDFLQQQDFDHLSLDELKVQSEQVQKTLDQLVAAKAAAGIISHKSESLTELQSDIQDLDKKLTTLPDQIETQEKNLKLEKTHLENLELKFDNQKLRASLEDHRNHLIEGEACPLCGALEHPYASDLPPVEDELETKIKQKQKEVDHLNQEWNKRKSTLELLTKDQIEKTKKLNSSKEELKKLQEDFSQKFSFDLNTNWDGKMGQLEVQKKNLTEGINQKRTLKVIDETLPKLTKMLEVFDLAMKTSADLKALYADPMPIDEKVKSFEKSWQQLQVDNKLLDDKKKTTHEERQKLDKTLTEVSQGIESHIKKHSISDITTALSYVLKYEKVHQLEAQKETFEKQKAEISIHKNNSLKVIQKLEDKDQSLSLEELNIKVEELKITEKSTTDNLDEIKRLLKNQAEHQQKIAQIEKRKAEVSNNAKYWILLNEMIGDATGKKFNNFAQELTLLQLLHLANQRLKKLSKRYIIAHANEDEDESLVIIDQDMGGQRRSVKTLSGGETFVLSLALALALSDLASNNVQIQSLFIDEGFGTLDPETLDQTLTTLEQLQEEGEKMIGIISHVSTLKERISTQIQIIPNGRGFSRVALMG